MVVQKIFFSTLAQVIRSQLHNKLQKCSFCQVFCFAVGQIYSFNVLRRAFLTRQLPILQIHLLFHLAYIIFYPSRENVSGGGKFKQTRKALVYKHLRKLINNHQLTRTIQYVYIDKIMKYDGYSGVVANRTLFLAFYSTIQLKSFLENLSGGER